MDKQKEILLTSEEITQLLDGKLFWIDIQQQQAQKEAGKPFPKSESETNTEYSKDASQGLGKTDLDWAWLKHDLPLKSEEPAVSNEVLNLYQEQQKLQFEREVDEVKLGLDMHFSGVDISKEQVNPRLEGRFVIGLISGIGLLTVVSWVYFVFLV